MNLGILKEGLKMDKTPLISVIIPVYNTGEYLKECLDSLRLQTYKNLEFICVDDGSTDNSLEILKDYAAQDKRFIILHQKNSGAGEARNNGLKAAGGKYVSFIDSDDRVSLCLYQNFVNLCQKIDIYIFNVCEYNPSSKDILPKYFFSIDSWNNHKNENSIHTFNDNINPFHGNMSAVNKIYSMSFLKSLTTKTEDNKLFPANMIFEDQYFFFLTMINAKSIIVNPNPQYYYRCSKINSVTQNPAEHVFDIFSIIDKIEAILIETNNYEAYKYAFFQHKYKQFAHLFFKANISDRAAFYNEMKTRLLKYKDEKLNPAICERLTLIGVYKNIIKLNAEEFYEKYKDKI